MDIVRPSSTGGLSMLAWGRASAKRFSTSAPRALCAISRVDLANENRISLRIGELDHLPLRDQEADFACINLVLHHLSDPGEGLREIRRSLTTGGHLFVADFLQHHDETMRSRYGDRWLGFDEERLQERLRQAGFEVLSCTRQAVGRGLFLLLVQARAC